MTLPQKLTDSDIELTSFVFLPCILNHNVRRPQASDSSLSCLGVNSTKEGHAAGQEAFGHMLTELSGQCEMTSLTFTFMKKPSLHD